MSLYLCTHGGQYSPTIWVIRFGSKRLSMLRHLIGYWPSEF